jgi:hypothetical protein
LDSIRVILDHFWDDEKESFKEWRSETEESVPDSAHVFSHMSTVDQWLKDEVIV